MDNNRFNNGRPKNPVGGAKNNYLDESFINSPRVSGHVRNESGEYRHSRQTKRARDKARIPLGWVVVIDVLIAAVLLLAFSLYYFIIPRDYSENVIKLPQKTTEQTQSPSASPSSSAPASNASVSPSQSPAETPNDTSWRSKFAEQFTAGDVVKDDHSYKSANINVNIEKVQKDGITYFLADIYVADIKYFKTAFASGKYEDGNGDHAYKIAAKDNAVVAINGDNSPRNKGPVVRNGDLYPAQATMDVLVMNNDGTMATYSPEEFNIEKLKTEGAWQAWTFGPMLLKDGQPMEKFNSGVNVANPRSAIGYYEPGHYCFLVVDGRQAGYSKGMTTQQMSQLFNELGCKAAFNLDGGQSAEMAFMGKLYNQPYDGGRPINDIVYIADE